MKTRFTPDFITELKENEIFVFGSNLEGMHGGGAARIAYEKFGAIWGQGVGLQGLVILPRAGSILGGLYKKS